MFNVDIVVSLGAWCQVKYQINKLCRSVIGSPFDWLVSPLSSLSMIFKDNGFKFAKELIYGEQQSVICAEYGVAYHHEFERDSESNPIIDKKSMLNVRSKLVYKLSKLKLDCRNKNVLFIRLGGHAAPAVAWPYIRDTVPLLASDINTVAQNIQQTLECRVFRILLVLLKDFTDFTHDVDLDSRIFLEFLDVDHPIEGWEGSTEAWRNLLLSLKQKDICDILAKYD